MAGPRISRNPWVAKARVPHPRTRDGKLYAQGAEGECDAFKEAVTGKILWSTNILKATLGELLAYGMAASPLVVDDKVIVQSGDAPACTVIALNRAAGAFIWKSLTDSESLRLADARHARRTTPIAHCDGKTGRGPERRFRRFALGTSLGRQAQEPQRGPAGYSRCQPVHAVHAAMARGAEDGEITKAPSGFLANTVWKNKFLKDKFTSSVIPGTASSSASMKTCLPA